MCWSSSRKCRIFFCAIEMHRKQNISAECESIAKYIWSHFLNFPLGNDHLTWRGGVMVFFKKKILIPNVAEIFFSDFGGEKKKKSDSELLSYNLMLNSGKTFCVARNKKINILTLVLSEKTFLNETKTITPPPPSS